MRVLVTPEIAHRLGIVLFRPGPDAMPLFMQGRVLLEPEPKSMRGLPSGVVPAVRQPLAEDKSLLPFFSNERVIRAAGGAGALSDWLLRHVKSCQWPHGDYHHSETVIHRYGTGAMVLCWHCDNQLRDQTSESLEQLAQQNQAEWMIDVIRHAMNGTQERELSLAELCWWAVCNQVTDALPETVLSRSMGLPAEKNTLCIPRKRHHTRRKDRHQHTETAHKNLVLPTHQQQNRPQENKVVTLTVDPDSPAQYLRRQKPQREEMPVYTRWVKTQKCMTCGNQADDPHHIIGHGLGGMGTKADDLFVIPLCRKCHNELHAGVKEFEEKHGSQLLLLICFLMHAKNSGVLKWNA
ncbi:DUF968 domain-containing protein [Escherichia coli]|nr:DUF968 domain-containing protein [Escherichia coli]